VKPFALNKEKLGLTQVGIN